MNFKNEILKSMQILIDKKIGDHKSDRTYKSIIKNITPKGYVILDETGNQRTVRCCIPSISPAIGQSVWVKVPMNNLKEIHICGVV